MSSKNMVICDLEKNYVDKLAAFMNEKRGLAFQVKICSDLEQVLAMQEKMPVDYLVITDSYSYEERTSISTGVTIILSSDLRKHVYENEISIFKYQSAEEICNQIILCLAEYEKKEVRSISKNGKGQIIGVYSPVHRVGQTTLALQKGKELAKKRNVLYLNLETYAGVGGYFPQEERTLSVLLYYAKQEIGNLGMLLPTVVRQMDGLDYVPPVLLPEEIKAVTQEEWLWLFSEILRTSIYEILILDLGESVQGLYEILNICDTLYLPAADDPVAASKLTQYEQVLYQLGYGAVWERMMVCDQYGTIAGQDSGKNGPVKRDRR